jgi:hypothetical protein
MAFFICRDESEGEHGRRGCDVVCLPAPFSRTSANSSRRQSVVKGAAGNDLPLSIQMDGSLGWIVPSEVKVAVVEAGRRDHLLIVGDRHVVFLQIQHALRPKALQNAVDVDRT